MTKILFLDIDGVLNNSSSPVFPGPTLNKTLIENLNSIVESVANLKIVISSGWRLHFSPKEIGIKLSKNGFKYPDIIFSSIEDNENILRPIQIRKWFVTNPSFKLAKYVVLDDTLMYVEPFIKINCGVQTNSLEGLTTEKAKEVIKLYDE